MNENFVFVVSWFVGWFMVFNATFNNIQWLGYWLCMMNDMQIK